MRLEIGKAIPQFQTTEWLHHCLQFVIDSHLPGGVLVDKIIILHTCQCFVIQQRSVSAYIVHTKTRCRLEHMGLVCGAYSLLIRIFDINNYVVRRVKGNPT